MDNSSQTVVVVKSPKSMALAVILTFIFGPLGMLYSTILGAVIMFVVGSIIGVLTAGIGLLVVWPVQIIWTVLAVNKYNANLRIN